SNTAVPVLSVWLLRGHEEGARRASAFEAFRDRVGKGVAKLSRRPGFVLAAYLAAAGLVIVIGGRFLGIEIFPSVDVGQFQLRLRAPAGTRIERTEKITLAALKVVADEVGPENVVSTLGFVGTQPPNYPINTIYLWTGGPEESVMQVQLKTGAAHVEALEERLRQKLAADLPGVAFSFEPSDIVSRVMSLGAATPVEVSVSSPSLPATRA